jgi:hypothetical protein
MKNYNPIHNRFMRLAMYVHKRRNGATVFVRRKVTVATDPQTGQSEWTVKTWKLKRVVILPARSMREDKRNVGALAANRAIVQGGGYDTGARRFLIDRRDVPPDLVLQKDDWLVFNDRHYDIEVIESYEFDTAWQVTAKELVGRSEVIEEIHNPQTFAVDVHEPLRLSDNAKTH